MGEFRARELAGLRRACGNSPRWDFRCIRGPKLFGQAVKMSESTEAGARPMYYEDLAIGRVYRSAAIEVTAEEITTFAARYDPQPFHLDAAAAKESVFGGLVASGWLTASLTMRLMVKSDFTFGSGVVGLGVESLRWPQPVRPGERLIATVEV